jgi:hypothetical protein
MQFRNSKNDRIDNGLVPMNVGDKVKVHAGRAARYGELIGLRETDHKIMLVERPEFASLSISEFKHFREADEVFFIDQEDHKAICKVITTSTGRRAMLIIGKEVHRG